MRKKIIGGFLIIFGISVAAFVFYKNSGLGSTTRPFSSYSILASSWEKYKTQFINRDGRVIDTSQGDLTTSEGQSYALLRAAWSDDKEEFDLVWNWTKNNLKRPSDNLFGWRWGKRQNGSYGFMENGGQNSASDADSDIAFALILAAHRFGNQGYLDQSKAILKDIWKIETAKSQEKRYLIAGNWAQDQNRLIINPSYFAPYQYRVFAKVDSQNDWNSLIDSSYELLNKASAEKLDKGFSVGLPPDWVALERKTGNLQAPGLANLNTDYSYDAARVPFRIGLDYQWNKEPKALEYLAKNFKFLSGQYKSLGKLYSAYAHDGAALTNIENPVMYATSLGYFLAADPQNARQIYQKKIVDLYSNAQSGFKAELPYYEQNWLWFGAALFNNQLVNY